jgi:2-methylcitrate dehydratase PrpD
LKRPTSRSTRLSRKPCLIDAIQDLIKKHGIRPEEIKEIKVKVDSVTMAGSIPEPHDGAPAQLSIPFSVAVAVVEGNASIYQYTDEKVRDPKIRSMMAKIFVEIDKRLDEGYPDKRSAQGDILLGDGRKFSTFMGIARGEPESPLSAQEIEEKFFFFTREILGERTEEICKQVKHLESLKHIGELVQKLKARVS